MSNVYIVSFATVSTCGQSGIVTTKIKGNDMQEAWTKAEAVEVDPSLVLGVNVVSAELVKNLTKTL